jgi:hypothetical protein
MMRNFFLGILVGIILLYASHTAAFGPSDLRVAVDSLKSMAVSLKLIDAKLNKLNCR